MRLGFTEVYEANEEAGTFAALLRQAALATRAIDPVTANALHTLPPFPLLPSVQGNSCF